MKNEIIESNQLFKMNDKQMDGLCKEKKKKMLIDLKWSVAFLYKKRKEKVNLYNIKKKVKDGLTIFECNCTITKSWSSITKNV